ncbi:hypothetical protein [Oricola sp.]|uniref:hypothetical protein n=1 Tax=Oricola sp. TaxID=1979950 RepID=UPI00351575C3
MKSLIGKAIIAAVALVCTAALAKNAHAACAAAQGSGTGYNTAHASQLAQFDAMRKMPGAAVRQAQYSQPACYYLDNQNAAVDLVRCTVTASWCTTPPLPQPPGTTVGLPQPTPPPNSGGRACSQLQASATAPSLSQARTTVYRSMRRALSSRGTPAGAPGVIVREPACLYQENRNARVDLVTCKMTAVACR